MQDSSQARKRPGWVWAISIFYFLSAAYTLLAFFLIYSGAVPLQPEQRAYFSQLALFDYGVTVLMGTLNLAGAVTLFLLRRIAFHLFTTAFSIGILMTVWHTVEKGWVAAIGPAGLVGAAIGWALAVTVCVYTWRLGRAGVLR